MKARRNRLAARVVPTMLLAFVGACDSGDDDPGLYIEVRIDLGACEAELESGAAYIFVEDAGLRVEDIVVAPTDRYFVFASASAVTKERFPIELRAAQIGVIPRGLIRVSAIVVDPPVVPSGPNPCFATNGPACFGSTEPFDVDETLRATGLVVALSETATRCD